MGKINGNEIKALTTATLVFALAVGCQSAARSQLTKLKVYAGATHPHTAQNPQPVDPALIGAPKQHG